MAKSANKVNNVAVSSSNHNRRPAREVIEERRKRILANNKDSIQTHVDMLNKAKQQVVR